ncbi:hypothetical protein [Sphingobacterium faecium]|uniref:hypothetical protein n=1 Tax=Sphingobacterium faecium TaxID=34087 RepID=UPI000D3AADF8|nr:hypothetical protein [Sphingobacterium faecium]
MLKKIVYSFFVFPFWWLALLRFSFFQKKNRKKESKNRKCAIAQTKKKNDLMGVPLGGNRSFIFFIGGFVGVLRIFILAALLTGCLWKMHKCIT